MVYSKKDTRPYGLDLSKLTEVDVVISEGRGIWYIRKFQEMVVVIDPEAWCCRWNKKMLLNWDVHPSEL